MDKYLLNCAQKLIEKKDATWTDVPSDLCLRVSIILAEAKTKNKSIDKTSLIESIGLKRSTGDRFLKKLEDQSYIKFSKTSYRVIIEPTAKMDAKLDDFLLFVENKIKKSTLVCRP